MRDQKDNINLGKKCLWRRQSRQKIVGLLGINLFQIFYSVFVQFFCNFVLIYLIIDYLWLLLKNSWFKNLWRIHCLFGKFVWCSSIHSRLYIIGSSLRDGKVTSFFLQLAQKRNLSINTLLLLSLSTLLQIVFSDCWWNRIKVPSTTKKNLMENDKGLGLKGFFTSVCHVFVWRLVLSFWLLRSLWQLNLWWGDDYLKCTTIDLYKSLWNSEIG